MSKVWKEYFIYGVDDTGLAAGTGVAFTDTIIKIDSDSDFEIIKRSHVSTSNDILTKFKDDTEGRYYQSVPLPLLGISGDHSALAALPFFLPYTVPNPILIKAATTYTAEYSDFSTAANSVRLALHGNKLRQGRAPWERPIKRRIPFDYNANITLSANETLVHTIPVNIDADFIVKKITGVRTGAALVTVKDTATDRTWMNTPIHINNFMGSGSYPNNLPSPRFILKGTGITLQVQDLSGAGNTVRITFSGEKLFF